MKNVAKVVSEAGQNLHDREEDQIDHQRQLPPVAVGHQPEDERPDGTEGERHSDRERHLGVSLVELLRDCRQRKDDEKKVECVEGPAEEAGEDGGAVAARRGAGERGRSYRVDACHAPICANRDARGISRD